MKIQEQDLYHGAALTQIVQDGSFKALNLASKKYGHYLVNTDRHVFVKYRKPNRSPWVHTFSEDDVATIGEEIEQGHAVFLCVVCGTTTVCALNAEEIATVLDLDATGQQWLRVEVPSGGSCRVSGKNGKLRRTIPHNSFPDKVFS